MVQIRVFSWDGFAKVVKKMDVVVALRGFRSFTDGVGNSYVQFFVQAVTSNPCAVVVYDFEPVPVKDEADFEKLKEAFIKQTLEVHGDWVDGVVE